MEKKEKFNQKEYNINYIKTHKTKFAVDLNKEEYKELCELLKELKITKVQFVRNAFDELKKSLKKQ